MILRLYNNDNSEIKVSNEIFVMEVENPKIFYNILLDFSENQTSVREIAVEIGSNILKPKDILCVSDFISFDIANKNIISKIYKYIETNISTQLEKRIKFDELVLKFTNGFMKFLYDINIELDCEETIEVKDALGMIKIKPLISDEFSILEKLIQYVNICAELKLIKLLVLVNVKSYLSQIDLVAFYKHCIYKGINVLLLESHHVDDLLEYEKKVLIDKDFCDIIIKSNQ